MAMISAPGEGTVDDALLARAARKGDGRAFATLYDRHERRVYGFCLRMLGQPEDAADAVQETFVWVLMRLPEHDAGELNFITYVLAAVRNVCYDMLGRRDTIEFVGHHAALPFSGSGGLEDDPERHAMLDASRELVAAAHDALPERQREVLALRELESLSYDDIGALVGMDSDAVAQLIARARVNLRNGVRGAALASGRGEGPDCDRALPLLAVVQDDQAAHVEDLAWLQAHLADCPNCRARREAMDEAGNSYRLLVPIIPLLWLRHATIAWAADAVGADWRETADRNPELDDQSALWRGLRRHRVAVTGGIALWAVVLLIFGVAATSDREAHLRPATNPALAGVASTGVGSAGHSGHTSSHAHHTSPPSLAGNQIATAAASVLTTGGPQATTLAAGTTPSPAGTPPATDSAPKTTTTAALGSRSTTVAAAAGSAAAPVTDTDATVKTATTAETTTTGTTTAPTQTETATAAQPTQTMTQPTTTQPATDTTTTPTSTCAAGTRCG